MTEETPVVSRFRFTESTEYDTVKVIMTRPGQLLHVAMEMYLDGQRTGLLTAIRGPLVDLVDQHVEAGDVTVEYDTPVGLFADADVPEWLRSYVDLRNPFLRKVSTPPTLVEQRREMVKDWAVANTDFGIMAKALVTGKMSSTADTLTGRKRNIGQVWWGFVLHNLAAAQHDPWLEHADIWPAIEHNITIDGHTFIEKASANEWNSVAGYFEAYSRIYKAPETYLTSAPMHVRLVDERPPVQETLSAGANEARRIVYGD